MTDNSKINDIYQDEIVTKPWGEERIFTPKNINYTFKMLKINKDCKISLQSHDEKVETFVLISGKANLIVGTSLDNLETIEMELLRGYTIAVNTIHRMIALTDNTIIMEGSTPETGTTIRYQDDYHRPNETEEIRNMKNRGWTENNSRLEE